jgi:proteasome lid subunit RPN8/RPN11
MNHSKVAFSIQGASWHLTFTEATIKFLRSHAQVRWLQKESVGQLFTDDLTSAEITITAATRLKPRRASAARVTFDPEEAIRQRETALAQGLYCVGFWHTHPEKFPSPSGNDERLAKDHAQAARSVLNGLAFLIVGNQPNITDWYLAIHDGQEFHRMREFELSPSALVISEVG